MEDIDSECKVIYRENYNSICGTTYDLYSIFNSNLNKIIKHFNSLDILYEAIKESGDFNIISTDNNVFKCHKCLLTCNKVLKEIIFNKDNKACSNNRWETDWSSTEVKVLIMLLYKNIKIKSNIEVSMNLIRLMMMNWE